jgi:hypothetical protein
MSNPLNNKMKDLKVSLILIMLFMLVLIPFVQSAPQTTIIERGVDIVYPQTIFVKQGQDLEINFWTYQSSDGQTLTNTSLNCTVYLMNSSGVNFFRFSNQPGASGLIKYAKGAPLCVNCWTMVLGAGNLSLGTYSYQIKCQGKDLTTPTALQVGGYDTGGFVVTPTGMEVTSEETNLIIIGLIVLFIFACFFFLLSYMFKHPGAKIFLMALSTITLIILLGMIVSNGALYLAQYTTIVNMYNTYYKFIIIMAGVCMFGIIGWLIYYSLQLFNKSRGVDFDD